uniref:hypothetical protein n=1 Tax=Brachyspira catarrhinii TaxID=2528966 RepID=UPI003F4C5261
MKRKISLLALLLTLILVSSCAKNNPLSANNTTNNDDSSILPDDDGGSIPPESNGGGAIEGISLDTKKILGIYSSQYYYYSSDKDNTLFAKMLNGSMNIIINKIETGPGIEMKVGFGPSYQYTFNTKFTGAIMAGTYYVVGYADGYLLHIIFDCRDYSLKRATIIERHVMPNTGQKLETRKSANIFIKVPLPQ